MSVNRDFNVQRPKPSADANVWNRCKEFTMTKRRMGTVPRRTYWTPAAVELIERFQEQQHLASFSAAAETLVRLGLQQSPPAIVTPAVTSAVRATVRAELNRMARLHVFTAIDAGAAYRMAGAVLRHVVPARYEVIKQEVLDDARRAVGREHLRDAVAGVLPDDDALLSDEELW
jgi:hypothetical protein